jgi:hypothetical protein
MMAKISSHLAVTSLSQVLLQSTLVFSGGMIMILQPWGFEDVRDPRRWPPSRHGGRYETSCPG